MTDDRFAPGDGAPSAAEHPQDAASSHVFLRYT